ncbi:TonB-dependent receptor [Tsuneonella mangrovi]|uniref:TonB-dependent receptor n=1 Tax=Tsuneonella mangrovi TaxID=1982042 RepID=UPI0014711E86|nr:TonB-dependent receptor [Tsuneonella mangrovi]
MSEILTGVGKSRTLYRILLCSAGGLAMVAAAQSAHAQDASSDTSQTKSGTDKQNANQPIANGNEIIVMARKQAETLQDTPVTIATIGGGTLKNYAMTDVQNVSDRVPTLNVQVGGSGSGGQISLRGIGSSNISAAFDSAVAFDYDGVQISTMRMVQAAFFDVKQVDVLKGPQSLYFGKSATAGVFSVRTADPTPDWEVGGTASYEFQEKGWTGQGYISGPLTDTLGIRAAAYYNDVKEYVPLQADTPAVNKNRGLRNFIGRLTFDWKPVAGFHANLKVQYLRNENDGAIARSDLYCGKNGIADPIVLLGGGGVPFSVVIPAGYNCNAFDGKFFLPDTAPPLAGSVPKPSIARGYNGVPFGQTDLWFGRLLMNMDVTDHLSITSTTGIVDLNAIDVDNYSYGGVGPAYTPLGIPLSAIAPALAAVNGPGVPMGVGSSDPRNWLKQYTQELRLASDYSGMFNFMLGAFYEWRKNGLSTAQNAVNIGLITPDPVTGYTYDYRKDQITKGEAWAVFGSAKLDLTSQLELSGGVRYTKETKVSRISVPYMSAILAANPLFVSTGYHSPPINFSDSNWSPEVTLKYEFTPDLNVFASFKSGFKSGGIDNSALPTSSLTGLGSPDPVVAAAVADGLKFQSERAIGGEVGFKSQLDDRRVTLNGTAYYYVFKNLQVQNFDPVAIQYATLNAGELTTKGIDVSWSWITPLDGFNLNGNLSLLDAKFSKTFITDTGQDLNGRHAARAPTFSGNIAFDYRTPITDTVEFGLSGNVTYSGSYFTAQQSLTDYKQDSFATFDATVSVGSPDGRWKLALIGNNIANKLYVLSSGGRPFLPGANPFGIPPGDDVILSENRGRQVFLQASFKY